MIGAMQYVANLAMTEDKCALTVLVSVMSTSHSDHVVVDAGSKTFGPGSLTMHGDRPGLWKGKPSFFGYIKEYTDLWFGRLSAETSTIFYMNSNKKLKVGDRLEIVPNNAFAVVNLHDQIYGVKNGMVEMVIPVTGRGRGY